MLIQYTLLSLSLYPRNSTLHVRLSLFLQNRAGGGANAA